VYELLKDIVMTVAVMSVAVGTIVWYKGRVEREGVRREKYLANIVENSADAIISCNPDGVIQSWNKGAEAMFGYAADDVVGKECDVIFPAESRYRDVAGAPDGKSTVKHCELELVSKDRRKVWATITCARIRNGGGADAGSSLIIKDMTDRKLLEERMQQSEKLIAVGQLAGGVAHEVFTPLNVISGNAEYLIMGLDKADERIRELQTIVGETERITRLIQRLMDFARPQKLEFGPVNINRSLSNVIDFMRSQLMKAKITVEMRCDESLPPVKADQNMIEQSILNILINAWQAMPHGGTLTVTTSLWHTEVEDAQAQIKIADTGYGIAPENMKRVFDPFFSTKDIGKGAGLGLTVSYRIIEDHGGSIAVDSAIGKGTTVTINLPVYPAT
ncbi:MAG TPA: ATP-binding protein, partial [bacterium]|nr:ATP-binding protein [bacterium]